MNKWNRFFYQIHKDVVLWLFVFLFLFLFRFVFVIVFHDYLRTSTVIRDTLRMSALGLRYDTLFATFWIIIPLITTVACAFTGQEAIAERVRRLMGSIFAVLASSACIGSIAFFREYREPFNYVLFNAYYDDTRAILATIWDNYHPLLYLVAISVIATTTIMVKRRIVDRGLISRERIASWTSSPVRRTVALAVIIVLVRVGLDEGAFGKPLRDRYDGVTSDELLNKAVTNPIMSLVRAYEDHLAYTESTGIDSYLADRDVRNAAHAVFHADGPRRSLDDYMRRSAEGAKNNPPRHVVLVVIESYDSWPRLPQFSSLRLTNSLDELARKGLSVNNFLPAAHMTMQSFSAILTSIPYTTGLEMNYQPSSRVPYPSSLAAAFRRLGYRTRLFYGGLLTWQRVGDFARDQGFEEVYGAPSVEDAIGNVEWTDWGILDEYLYHFVTQTIDPDQPSFNVVLTTTNHPPFDVDMWAKGYAVRTVPPDLTNVFDDRLDMNVLGHLWYADHCLGAFVRETEAKLPRTVFAITGDHWSRRFPNARPTFFEQSSVPFVLYGKEVLQGLLIPPRTAGSHIDIAPTLIELAAPKGFVYYSVGSNLLSTKPHELGIGYHKVIGPDFIADMNTETFHPLPERPLPKVLPDITALRTTFNDYYGVAWWRVKRGPQM
ncbi:MAG TPA: LTA synthase family protein [Nitrospirota bacterium]|nr:LTA synthase family protein [Nitrospirota bacterium]